MITPENEKVDLRAQAYILATNPFNPKEKLNLTDLVDFILFDENNKAVINDSLYVIKTKK